MTDTAALLYMQLWAAGLPLPEREYRFCERRWRLDLAYVGRKLAIECEGGVWIRGRHSRGAGFTADCKKYNAAVLAGWRLLRYTTQQVESGEALDELEKVLKGGDAERRMMSDE